MASASLRLFTFHVRSLWSKCARKTLHFQKQAVFECASRFAISRNQYTNTVGGRIRGHTVLLAGILSWLGLKEEEETEDPLVTSIKRGILCMNRQEYDKAEVILHLALKIAQDRQDMQGQRYIFDVLANVALQKGDFPKAEKLFIELMKELIAIGTDTEDNSIVEISLKLASIYSQQNDDTKAEQGFQFCINAQEKKLKSINMDSMESLTDLERDTALLWAMSVDWYGKHLLSRGALTRAADNFQKALAVSEKINGPTHPQTLVLMNDIGSVASLQKDYDKAISHFEKAIASSSKSDISDELPAFYCNLGATYLLKGDSVKAKKACSQALDLARKIKNSTAESEALECLAEIKSST